MPATPEPPTIAELDGVDEDTCRTALAPLFEGAPRFLTRLCTDRPFIDGAGLFVRARALAHAMPEREQLELIDAHPRLGAAAEALSSFSRVEQSDDRGSVEADRVRVAAELERLNDRYEARFGFRYCVFVDGRPHEALLPGFRAALAADRNAEIDRALDAVIDIAADRYRRLTSSSD